MTTVNVQENLSIADRNTFLEPNEPQTNLTQKENNTSNSVTGCAYSDCFKSGTTLFSKLIAARSSRLQMLLKNTGPMYRRKASVKLDLIPTFKSIAKPINALRKVISQISIIEKPLCLCKKKGSMQETEKRRRQLEYGKWYLKPNDYGKSSRTVVQPEQ